MRGIQVVFVRLRMFCVSTGVQCVSINQTGNQRGRYSEQETLRPGNTQNRRYSQQEILTTGNTHVVIASVLMTITDASTERVPVGVDKDTHGYINQYSLLICILTEQQSRLHGYSW